MKITCDACQNTIRIPDEKIPEGKSFSIGCPNCKQKVTVPAPISSAGAQKYAEPETRTAPAVSPSNQNAGAGPDPMAVENGAPVNPFEFLEEGAKTAVICEPVPKRRADIRKVVEAMAYHIRESDNARDTLKQMRFHDFDLVVLNERFDTRDPEMNHVLKYLGQLNMRSRRNMFLVLLSDRLRTMDKMEAFNKSVNLIVNLDDMDNFSKILQAGLADHDNFYRVFKEIFTQVKGY